MFQISSLTLSPLSIKALILLSFLVSLSEEFIHPCLSSKIKVDSSDSKIFNAFCKVFDNYLWTSSRTSLGKIQPDPPTLLHSILFPSEHTQLLSCLYTPKIVQENYLTNTFHFCSSRYSSISTERAYLD